MTNKNDVCRSGHTCDIFNWLQYTVLKNTDRNEEAENEKVRRVTRMTFAGYIQIYPGIIGLHHFDNISCMTVYTPHERSCISQMDEHCFFYMCGMLSTNNE